jgi:carbon monoxide dehydrogenase subunit G
MARIRVSTTIAAAPADVWRELEDIERHSEWMADAIAVRFTSARRRGVGTTFDCETKVGPVRLIDRMAITEWQPRKAMGVRHHGVVTGEGRFTLRRAGRRRTRFTWDERLRFPWWLGGPVGGLVGVPVLSRLWRRSLRELARTVEASAPPRQRVIHMLAAHRHNGNATTPTPQASHTAPRGSRRRGPTT